MSEPAAVLSIQSHVAFGHVGNGAAVFPLQRLGFEVWPVHTCQLSTHTGYPGVRGMAFPPEHVADVVAGLAERGVLGRLSGVLSGYLARPEVGAAVLAAVATARQGGRDVLYLCDPVMGDDGPDGEHLYAAPGIPEFMREHMVPVADVLTPNRFELALLAERPVSDLAEAVAAARALLRRGPRLVVVTSLNLPAEPTAIACLAVTAECCWTVSTPRLSLAHPLNGAGDALAALLLGHLLKQVPAPEALAAAVSGLHAAVVETRDAGCRELQIVAAQDALVRPSRVFHPRPMVLTPARD